jgi:HK97 family phage major capsid protein
MKIKALHEEKGRLIEELNALQTSINTEARSMSDSEKTRFNEIDSRLDSIGGEIETLEKLQKRAAEKVASAPVYGSASTSDKTERQKMVAEYSFKRAIEQATTGRREGVEFEMHKEAANEFQRAGVSVSAHSVLIPSDAFKRDMTATGGSGGDQGGVNIQTNVGGIIDVLLPRHCIRLDLGVTRFDNLTGNLDLPKANTQPAAGWNTENGTAAEKSPTFGKVSFSPKRLAAFIQVSNQLLRQSSNSIDAYVRNYLAQAMAQELEKAAILGGGTNEPTGIISNADVNVIFAGGAASNATNANGAAVVWADVVNAMKAVESNNAMGQAYLTNPLVKAALQTTGRQASGVEGNFILQSGAGELNGYPLAVTTNVPSTLSKGAASDLSAMIFGDFSKLAIASWGGMELTVDPFSGATAGLTNMVLNAYMDVNLLQPKAFAVCKDIDA